MIEETKKKIPTNIVTGFLGAGKTTVIQQLLKQKPADERWAILVNEFGEVGIDSNLFAQTSDSKKGVTISQVPGGCMCCTNGLPMQMALNLLLAKSKPHRLLIEPTGLGHPKEILAILAGEYYLNVLDLQATFALVDARKVKSDSYTSNAIFNQQIEIADVVIANKSDLYDASDFSLFLDFIESRFGLDNKLIYQVQHGAVQLEWLGQSIDKVKLQSIEALPMNQHASSLPLTIEAPKDDFVRADNDGDGFFSRGWVFNPEWKFDAFKLHAVIQGVEVERLKAIFITSVGPIGFNKVDSIVTQLELDQIVDSRAEVISSRKETLNGIEESLLQCLADEELSLVQIARLRSDEKDQRLAENVN